MQLLTYGLYVPVSFSIYGSSIYCPCGPYCVTYYRIPVSFSIALPVQPAYPWLPMGVL